MTRLAPLLLLSTALLGSSHLLAQQDYVGRFDLYSGFTWMNTPAARLQERGYHLQAGFNMRTWLALGFDYSVVTGNSVLRPDMLKTNLADQIDAQLAALQALGLIPPGYQVAVASSSTTQTFAAGPQLEIRKLRWFTFFVRPSIGAIYESATLHPTDAFTTGIVQQLGGTNKTDWSGFYGVGGGVDFNATQHFHLRVQADYVHNSLFSDLLKDSRNTVRLSIGPAFSFGRNIVH